MRNSYKNYLLLAITLILLAFFGSRLLHQKNDIPDNALLVGTQSAYPPFEFLSPSGELIGFDIDIAKRIGEKLDRPLVFKDMEFEGLILSLKQGKIDMIMSGMDITPSRLREITMIPYHGTTSTTMSLVFWSAIPFGVYSIDDIGRLPNGSISVESGSTPEIFMQHYPDVRTKSFQGTLSAIMDVKYGKSTANLVERDVAEYLKKEHPEIRILEVPLPKDTEILGFGIGIKKTNLDLIEQVQQIIDDLKSSGELTKLEDKWFKREQK